jgi:hypothetical protein
VPASPPAGAVRLVLWRGRIAHRKNIDLEHVSHMVFLTVPYAQKDAAKALGARWNPTRRRWYVADGVDTAPFAKWIDAASAAAGAAGPSAAPAAPAAGAKLGRVDSYQGKTVVGVNYVALEHDCNPLEACPTCTEQLAGMPWSEARAGLQTLVSAMPGTSNLRPSGTVS